MGGVRAVVQQEHEQAVAQVEGVRGAGPRLPLAGAAGLPFGLGRSVPGFQFGQQSVEHVGGDPGQLAERARTPAEAAGVAHPDIVAPNPLSCSDSNDFLESLLAESFKDFDA